MKKILASAVAASLVMGTVVSTFAFAQTQSYTSSNIVINGQAAYHPDEFVANGTTYMPIWYVMQALEQVGYKSTWNGHVWAVTSPNNTTALHIVAKTGHTLISVNGQLVEYEIPTMVANDPTSDGNSTTYMPIWYVQQLLNNVGITTDTWNGTTWTIGTASGASTKTSTTSTSTPSTTSAKTPTNGMATKLEAAVDFYNFDENVARKYTPVLYTGEYELPNATPDPYTDVPQSDWAAVHYDLFHGLITADSSTLFGSNDPATANTMDEQYMWSMGIPKNSPLQLSWNPGDGNAVQWANFYDLNTGVPTSGDLTVSQLNQLEQSFVTSQKGWYETSNGVYHFAFAPYNTYTLSEGSTWSASHSLSELKQSLVYTSTITFKKIGGSGSQPDLLWTLPGFSIHSPFIMMINGGSDLKASTNGGKSYQSFDSIGDGHGYSSYNPQNGATANPSNPVYVKNSGGATINLDPMPVGAGYGSFIEFTDAGVPEVQQKSFGI